MQVRKELYYVSYVTVRQVSPSELEDLLLQHPGVVDVGVVGVEDVRAGELPRAYVVREKGTTEEDLHKFLEPRVAKHKQLKGGIRFVDALPKNATGKILKRELKKMAAEDPWIPGLLQSYPYYI